MEKQKLERFPQKKRTSKVASKPDTDWINIHYFGTRICCTCTSSSHHHYQPYAIHPPPSVTCIDLVYLGLILPDLDLTYLILLTLHSHILPTLRYPTLIFLFCFAAEAASEELHFAPPKKNLQWWALMIFDLGRGR